MSPNKSRTFAKGARPDWPKYTVRNINPDLWARVIARAKAESHDGAPHLNAVLLHMLELYAATGLPALPGFPSVRPTSRPTSRPSTSPSTSPSTNPSSRPSVSPSTDPSVRPSTSRTSRRSTGPHPSHHTRISMSASTYDEICEKCGATDITGGGWGQLADPCPSADPTPRPSTSPTSNPTARPEQE